MDHILFYLGLLILDLSTVSAYHSHDCTSNKECECTKIRKTYLKADCSRKKLTEIPLFKESVIEIDISRNGNLTIVRTNNGFPQHLERLDISSCNLQSVELGAFEKLKDLTSLDISRNNLLTLDVLPNITNDLIGSKIHTLKFKAIQCSVGEGVTLKYEHLCRLRHLSLKVLDMSKNRLDMIEQFTLLSLPSTLTNISMGHNRLRFGMYFLEFSSLENVRYLNMNKMYTFGNPFEHPWGITCNDDNRNYNPERTSSNMVQCPRLNRIGKPNIPNQTLIMHMPPKLETIVMNKCIIRLTKKWNNLVLKFNSLKKIIANHMFLKELKGFDYSGKLREAYLSNCFITNADDLFFSTSNLTILDLSKNLLGDYFSTSRSAKHFHTQKFLRILDISGNRLQAAPSNIFIAFTRLEVLNISATELTRIRFKFHTLTSLKTLDLSNNKIRKFTDANMETFDILSKGTALSLNLTGNDISCSCETLNFLIWLQNKQRKGSRIKLTNFKNYTCVLANSKQRNFTDISEIILELEKQCSSKSAIFIVSGLLLFGFMMIVISGILYRYRWTLRYIYHMTRRSLRGYFLLQNQDGSEKKFFEFDAFISYAEEDVDFAHEALKSKVQNKYPKAKLCYHSEHFLPGRSIPESIVNAVNCSRKTVCVLSEHFLVSEWCIYEFKMANLEKIYKRGDQDSLLILMLGSINLERVPVDIMTYLKSRSYIEDPKNINESDDFWNHIISAIMEE